MHRGQMGKGAAVSTHVWGAAAAGRSIEEAGGVRSISQDTELSILERYPRLYLQPCIGSHDTSLKLVCDFSPTNLGFSCFSLWFGVFFPALCIAEIGIQ